MATVKELKSELKAKGIKGITGKKKAELEAMLDKAGGEKSKEDVKKKIKTPKMSKQISAPKEKVSMKMQEELAKAGMRGSMKKKCGCHS